MIHQLGGKLRVRGELLERLRIDLVEYPKAIIGTTTKLPGSPTWGRLIQGLPIPRFLSGRKGQLLLDKNPSPTGRLRVWLRVFPELRVIIALRDPRDVILSCFFQNIPINAINSNFLSLNRAVVHYTNLMDIWLTVKRWRAWRLFRSIPGCAATAAMRW